MSWIRVLVEGHWYVYIPRKKPISEEDILVSSDMESFFTKVLVSDSVT